MHEVAKEITLTCSRIILEPETIGHASCNCIDVLQRTCELDSDGIVAGVAVNEIINGENGYIECDGGTSGTKVGERLAMLSPRALEKEMQRRQMWVVSSQLEFVSHYTRTKRGDPLSLANDGPD